MRVGWQRYSDGKSMVLNATLGEQVNARFLHRENQKGGSYFYAGAVGVNKKIDLPQADLSLDILYPSVDIAAWRTVVDEFSTATSKTDKRERPRSEEHKSELQSLTRNSYTGSSLKHNKKT